MILDRLKTAIPGCFELRPRIFADPRGSFVKTFHRDAFAQLGLRTDWAEQFHSCSHRGVLRGLHFQTPPHDHAKLVYCSLGEVLDVAVDLRRGSPAEGRAIGLHLSATAGNMLYLPSGLAHGFLALSEKALMVYNVTSVHAPGNDAGVAWDSVGVDWGMATPLVSERDAAFPSLAAFASPFVFDPGNPAA